MIREIVCLLLWLPTGLCRSSVRTQAVDRVLNLVGTVGVSSEAALSLNEGLSMSWIALPIVGHPVHSCGKSLQCELDIRFTPGLAVATTFLLMKGSYTAALVGEMSAQVDSPFMRAFSPVSVTVGGDGRPAVALSESSPVCQMSSALPVVSKSWMVRADSSDLVVYDNSGRQVSINVPSPVISFSFSSDSISIPRHVFQTLMDSYSLQSRQLALLPTIVIELGYSSPPVIITPPMYVDAKGASALHLSNGDTWVIGLAFMTNYTVEFNNQARGIKVCMPTSPGTPELGPGYAPDRWLNKIVGSLWRPRRHSTSSSVSSVSDT